jgi:hypothetical protein
MPEVDPVAVNAQHWQAIGDWLHWLWAYFFVIVILSFTFLTSHAVIPSLVASRHLPPVFLNLRKPLYLGAAAFVGLAVLFMVWTVDNSHLLEAVYNRFWI